MSDIHSGPDGSASILAEAPLDVLICIAEWLSLIDIAKFGRTAKVYSQRLWISPTLWRRLYHRDISDVFWAPNQKIIEPFDSKSPQYRGAYREIALVVTKNTKIDAIHYAAGRGYEKLLRCLLHPGFYTGVPKKIPPGVWGPTPETSTFESMAHRFNIAMNSAAKWGHVNIIDEMMAQGATDWHGALVGAAKGGQLAIVKDMAERAPDSLNTALIFAAGEGHLDIVQEMIKRGAQNWDNAMGWAAEGGHIDVVREMIAHGKSAQLANGTPADFLDRNLLRALNMAMESAALGGHAAILEELVAHGGNNWDSAMIAAAQEGHLHIVNSTMDHGATNWNRAMAQAALSGRRNIVNLMIERGATEWYETCAYAATSGHMDIVMDMVDRASASPGTSAPKDPWERALACASLTHHQEIVEYLQSVIRAQDHGA